MKISYINPNTKQVLQLEERDVDYIKNPIDLDDKIDYFIEDISKEEYRFQTAMSTAKNLLFNWWSNDFELAEDEAKREGVSFRTKLKQIAKQKGLYLTLIDRSINGSWLDHCVNPRKYPVTYSLDGTWLTGVAYAKSDNFASEEDFLKHVENMLNKLSQYSNKQVYKVKLIDTETDDVIEIAESVYKESDDETDKELLIRTARESFKHFNNDFDDFDDWRTAQRVVTSSWVASLF